MSAGPYEQGQAFGASRIDLWLRGAIEIEPEFAPIWTWCLASNLANAAGLTKSFVLGRCYSDDLWDVDRHGELWRPGCGRSAP